MRVFQINSVYAHGSTGRIAEGIAETLLKNGHSICTAYGRGKRTQKSTDSFRFTSTISLASHLLKSRLTDRQGFYSKCDTERLLKKIYAFKPDIVQMHNLHGYYLNIPMFLRGISEMKIPVVATLHDCWLFTGHCAHFDFIGCDKWLSGCGDCPQLREYPSSYLCDASARNHKEKKLVLTNIPSFNVVCPSNWLSGIAKRSFLGKFNVITLPNGVDISTFCPDGPKIEGISNTQKIILGAASPWSMKKGLDSFFELRKRLPASVSIILIGMDSKNAKKLPRGIIGIPRTKSAQDMASWYRTADVFVNASFEETLPTTNIEALACGTPVVTADSGGMPETVNENIGTVYHRGDIAALTKAVEESLCQDKNSGKLARVQFAVKNFESNACFNAYVEFYKTILKEGKDA